MMDKLLILVWTVVIFASVTWYAVLLYVIGVRGGRDIVQMIQNLKARNHSEDTKHKQ